MTAKTKPVSGAGSAQGRMMPGSRLLPLALAGIGVVAMAIAALLTGPYPVNLAQAWSVATGGGDEQVRTILLDIRLPRVLAALVAGAALAAAGASYQALFRNPLVSPDILGVSSGAGLGAVLGIFLSLPVFAIQAFAFAGGIGAVAAVMLVASAVRNADRTLVLVLTGVVIGALAGAMTSLLKVMADPYDQLPAITFWLLGSLASVTTGDLTPVLPAVIIGLVPLALLSWRINILSLGDDEARALGIEAGRLRLAVIVSATLVTASVTALAGVIGWVGLVIPHIARMITGPEFSRLLPLSVIIGAGYLLVVDTLARTLSQVEIPLGILTAVIGAPFFVWLLMRSSRSWS